MFKTGRRAVDFASRSSSARARLALVFGFAALAMASGPTIAQAGLIDDLLDQLPEDGLKPSQVLELSQVFAPSQVIGQLRTPPDLPPLPGQEPDPIPPPPPPRSPAPPHLSGAGSSKALKGGKGKHAKTLPPASDRPRTPLTDAAGSKSARTTDCPTGGRAGPCPGESRDVVTRLVAFVPLPIKILIGALAALALGLAGAGLASRRRLAHVTGLAATDSLTGLPNHAAVQQQLEHMIGQATYSERPLVVVLFDLDNFKQVNDIHGHLRGDAVIKAVGETARAELRENDFVGRYGGEEFVAILPGADRPGALMVVERLRRKISELKVPGVPGAVTISLGVAAFPHNGTSRTELLMAADHALYKAKAAGRNQVFVATNPQAILAPGSAAPNGLSRAAVGVLNP